MASINANHHHHQHHHQHHHHHAANVNVTGPARLPSIESGANELAAATTVARKFNVTNLDDEQDEATMTKRIKQHKKWNRRFKFFFCCVGYKRNKVCTFAYCEPTVYLLCQLLHFCTFFDELDR